MNFPSSVGTEKGVRNRSLALGAGEVDVDVDGGLADV